MKKTNRTNQCWRKRALPAMTLILLIQGCVEPGGNSVQKTAPPAPPPANRNYEAQMPPREAFDRYMADLRATPADYIARGKIIQIVSALDPKPARPPELDIVVGKAVAAMKNAASQADYAGAGVEFQKACDLAPWIANYYNNTAVAFEKAGQPGWAADYYYWYLVTAPSDPQAPAIREHMGELKYAAEKAAKFQALLASLNGTCWVFIAYNGLNQVMRTETITIANGKMSLSIVNGITTVLTPLLVNPGSYILGEISPTMEVEVAPEVMIGHFRSDIAAMHYKISPDFTRIISTEKDKNGAEVTRVYNFTPKLFQKAYTPK